ncbi:DUF3078 domain-containing protein [Spirosoma oryzicola]|nr:DUF3078 domain-containing protein [Spirosoma oryzicola]UHG90791.1 DUF3078 domain-containing protein [Spirosoma oryzicola]
MIRKYCLLVFLTLVGVTVRAQDSTRSDSVVVRRDTIVVINDSVVTVKDTTYWQKSFNGSINFNQTSFSNWAGGGTNSISLGTLVNTRALYLKDKWSWDNTADIQLGYLIQLNDTRKSADVFMLNSVVGYKFSPKWSFSGSAAFNTFFAPGFRYDSTDRNRLRVSNFFSPALLTLALGVSFTPTNWFSLQMNPFAPRLTTLTDNRVRIAQVDGVYVPDPTATVYGVPPGRSIRLEWLAFQLHSVIDRNLTKNIKLNARYQLYANYLALNAIDHRLDLTMTAKLIKFLSVTFNFIGFYDRDFSTRLQVQQTIALSLAYNFSTFRKK